MEKQPIERLRIKVGSLERNMKALKITLCEAFLLLIVVWPLCNAAAQSPSTIGGRTLQMTISSGNFPFASSGSYRFLPSATSSSYAIVPISGAVAPSSGTHSYTRTGANTAQLAFTDSFSGSLTANCTFTTANSGTYSLTGISVPGSSQTGTFFLYSGTSPAAISGYSFTVTVTSGASPFASSGMYRFLPAAAGNTYNIVGLSGIPNSSGTYSYTQNSTMTGILSFNDSITGPGLTSQLSFDTATSGTVLLRQSGNNGFQTATFSMVPAARPTISVNPQSQTVRILSNITFTVSASGVGTLSYQWRKNSTNISGATGPSYTISNVQATDPGSYDVVVSNGAGATISAAATLTIASPPTISVQPLSLTVTVWQTASFLVGATGTQPLTYRWRKDGVILAGATNASFSLSGVQSNQAGNYSVAVANTYGSVTSAVAVLTVIGNSPGTVVAWGRNDRGQATIPPGATGVTAVSAGYSHTVALKVTGTVMAWGDNSEGQTNVRSGLTGVGAIGAGFLHTVALRTNGVVVAWGLNAFGQTSVPAGLTGVMAIAAGNFHTAAVKNDGTVVAWGFNGYGQTNVPAGLAGVSATVAGASHSVALLTNDTVVAWGAGGGGLSGIPHFGQSVVPVGLSRVKAVAAGGYHTVALKSDGTVVAWGRNDFGQTNVPAGLSGVTAIAAGQTHTVALRSDGTVVAWGNNDNGQTSVPAGLSGATAIAAGGDDTVALIGTGFVAPTIVAQPASQTVNAGRNVSFTVTVTGTGPFRYQWRKDGTNLSGVMSDTYSLPFVQTNQAGSYDVVVSNVTGSITSAPPALLVVKALAPSPVVAWGRGLELQTDVPDGLSGVTAIAAGAYHTVALKAGGVVVAWGLNDTGQTNVPTGLGGVAAIAAGGYHTVALKSDGTVVAWGRNNFGQVNVPDGLAGVIAIATGGFHTVALKSDGTVVAWGRGIESQTAVPPGLSGVTAIAAGYYHTVALKSNGTLVAWGYNNFGQKNVPSGLIGVSAIAAGGYHTVALKNNRTVVAWGANGQTTIPASLSGVTAIAAGQLHTVALTSDGTVVAWGDNFYWQTNVPSGLSGVTAIAAGGYHTLALIGTGVSTAPNIATTSTSNTLTLSWPAAALGYRVESALSATPPVAWSNVTGTFYTNGGVVRIDLPTIGTQKFFRLTKP